MKKLFTLLLAVGSISIASAQGFGQKDKSFKDEKYESRNDRSGDFGKDNQKGVNDYSFSIKERERQIEKINREFDLKILMVKRSRHLRAKEKSRQIRMLDNERFDQIKDVQIRFERSKNRGYDRGYEKNDNRKW
jgi:hypothetical protein